MSRKSIGGRLPIQAEEAPASAKSGCQQSANGGLIENPAPEASEDRKTASSTIETVLAAAQELEKNLNGAGQGRAGEAPVGREAAGGETPDTCNTGVPKRHPWLSLGESGGVDTMHASVYGAWNPQEFITLRETLNDLQRAAQGTKSGEAEWELPDGSVALMHAAGGRVGNTFYRWKFTWQGNRVYLADRDAETFPIAYVQFKSLPLMQLGHVQLWKLFLEFLDAIGVEFDREVLGRVDACVDLLDGIGALGRLFTNGQTISRSQKSSAHWGGLHEIETIQFGSRGSAVLCRIYDKSEELLGDGVDKLAKAEVLQQKRWGVGTPSHATRVEFEISGDALKEHFNVRTVAELEDAWPHIIAWLMGGEDDVARAEDIDAGAWLRFTDRTFDRQARNYSRDVKTAVEWKVVREAFYRWINKPTNPVPLPPRKVTVPTSERLLKQAAGCMRKAAAMAEDAYRDVESLRDWAWNVMKPFFGSQQDLEDVMLLRTECETNHGQVFWEQSFAPEVPEPFPEFAADQNREPRPLPARLGDWKKALAETARGLWGDAAAYQVTLNLAGT